MKKYPGYRSICLDKLSYSGDLFTISPVMDKSNFRFVEADICNRKGVKRGDCSSEEMGIFSHIKIIGTQR